ncbi:MAG: hypothetical protein JWL81_1619 [Verrucomicrobiales bacterium]|nr:hypothetical protein [Verrucomicrobiales bacterium]
MKTHRNRLSSPASSPKLYLRQPRSRAGSTREDRIFRNLFPSGIHEEAFTAEGPRDWGNLVLAEGDLSGSLVA